MCQTLEWRMNQATPIDLAKLILNYADSNYDFSEIYFHVSSLAFICLIGKLKFVTQFI